MRPISRHLPSFHANPSSDTAVLFSLGRSVKPAMLIPISSAKMDRFVAAKLINEFGLFLTCILFVESLKTRSIASFAVRSNVQRSPFLSAYRFSSFPFLLGHSGLVSQPLKPPCLIPSYYKNPTNVSIACKISHPLSPSLSVISQFDCHCYL